MKVTTRKTVKVMMMVMMMVMRVLEWMGMGLIRKTSRTAEEDLPQLQGI